MFSTCPTTVNADSSTTPSATGSSEAFMSVLITTNSWTFMPMFLIANVIGPAGAVAGPGVTFPSISSTATDPVAVDGDATDAAGAAVVAGPLPAQPDAIKPDTDSATMSGTPPVRRIPDPPAFKIGRA